MKKKMSSDTKVMATLTAVCIVTVLIALLMQQNGSSTYLQGSLSSMSSSFPRPPRPPNCDAERMAAETKRIALVAKINAYNGKVARIADLEAAKLAMIAGGGIGSQSGAVYLQYQINTLTGQLPADLAVIDALRAEYNVLLAAYNACLVR
jgi:hypothetical protein